VARPELAETKKKIPTAIGSDDGLRTKPAPMPADSGSGADGIQRRKAWVVAFFISNRSNATAEAGKICAAQGFLSLFPQPPPPRAPLWTSTPNPKRKKT